MTERPHGWPGARTAGSAPDFISTAGSVPDLLISAVAGAIPGAADASARLSADHHLETAVLQRTVDQVTALVAQPWFVTVLVPAMLVWVAANGAAAMAGYPSVDAPQFSLLQTWLGMMGVTVSALILSSQRRQDKLASHRDQLSLELAILNDQKVSKVIALLEEIRRDSPTLANRIDRAAHAMSTPADTQTVLDAIKHPDADEAA